MDHHDDNQRFPTFSFAYLVLVISVAEGILVEMYLIGSELARSLLESRATAAGAPVLEAASRLICADVLP
ncbi:hypothetical protein AB0P21_39065 [Kribbella sp. NPDC056861]|uniref:hypothetical protein n=1 Tax=Kribbella sp. NPDC056861 TaxID=3154857 RepID=UPI003413E47B